MQKANDFESYRSKAATLAVEIDAEWYEFLVRKGFSNVILGDFFVRGYDGDSIWSRKGFLSLFELAPVNKEQM